ncbi:MAG: hypothetical protein EOP04_01985 [Proteobacteria bacterium]|nr:MAG: hypothetical protein EOP04_01985 [Pseudomonadota bacterium]
MKKVVFAVFCIVGISKSAMAGMAVQEITNGLGVGNASCNNGQFSINIQGNAVLASSGTPTAATFYESTYCGHIDVVLSNGATFFCRVPGLRDSRKPRSRSGGCVAIHD